MAARGLGLSGRALSKIKVKSIFVEFFFEYLHLFGYYFVRLVFVCDCILKLDNLCSRQVQFPCQILNLYSFLGCCLLLGFLFRVSVRCCSSMISSPRIHGWQAK